MLLERLSEVFLHLMLHVMIFMWEIWGADDVVYMCWHHGCCPPQEPSRITFAVQMEARRICIAGILHGIWINKNYRGMGYGSELVRIIEEVAKNLNLNSILLDGDVSNPGYWEHLGYAKIGEDQYQKVLEI